ncbi:MAG: RHH/copG family antitoxin [Candidatus Methanohalarchaeum thermophilum]|uniref:RHH/copG family antitoxin n=1 Tax=Methanohalarchaeum thermophilum TaxID=1903181 RepID=A0A1Q6DV15_METT1|nr:MAG: RHH/copG family antitoxin [Candidatus Methanohalarchaeum thermophilum]
MTKSNPRRVTIVLDDETEDLLEDLKEELDSNQSEVLRKSLNFYANNRDLIEKEGKEIVKFYTDMLLKGEHIILDVDHWTIFLDYLNDLPEENEFWNDLSKVARNHAEQLKEKIDSPKEYLKRIESCNFYDLQEEGNGEFTLILRSKETRRFISQLVGQTLTEMGFEIKIKENISKIRVKVK